MAQLENELAWKLASSLADRIGGDRYELYFDEQSFSLEHGRLLVQASDDFTLERLRAQFVDSIRQTVDFVLGTDVQVVYCLKGEAPSQQSLFPEMGLELNDSSAKETSVSVTSAALSLDTTADLKAISAPERDFRQMDLEGNFRAPTFDRQCPDQLESDYPAGVGTERETDKVILAESRSNHVGRVAGAVKRQTEDQLHGQLSLFSAAELAEPIAVSELESIPKASANLSRSMAKNNLSDSSQPLKSQPTSQAQSSKPQSSPAKPSLPGSRAAMTMATFQFGDENRLAKAAMEQILQRPGLISPVVIHGPVGCGKSHLATGLGHQLRGAFRAFSVLHLSAEQFTSRFLEALNGSGLPNMRAKFREMDMLVLEDIQFFQNKKATIIELQHTVDALIKAGKQIILTADRHPNDLTFLGSEVQTRLVSGLVVSLNPADREARAQVCRQWSARQGMKIDESLVQWMADHIVGDVRRLSGALFRVLAIQLSTGETVTASTAMDLLSDYVSASHSICSLGQIQKVVCDVCGIDAKELNGAKRTRKISGARMLAMFLARKHTQAALSEIGDFFGGRRHSTVLAAAKRIKTWEQKNELIETGMQAINTREVIRKVEAKLQAM